MRASTFLSLNPFYIVVLAPVFIAIWSKLNSKGREPGSPGKFGIALILAGVAFGSLFLGIKFFAHEGKIGMIWLVLVYLFLTMGELCLSPVGLSAVTKLSPLKIVGLMMGAWFLSTAAAEYIAALFSSMASVETTGGRVASAAESIGAYFHLFGLLSVIGLSTGALLLIIAPYFKKMTHGAD